LPTTTPATSLLTPRSASYPSISSPPKTTRRSPTSTASPRPFSSNARSAIRDGFTRFKAQKDAAALAAVASKHHLATAALQTFMDGILDRMVFDGEQLSDLLAPLDLGWKARTQAELALMADLHPVLTKRAQGRDISGLSAYEQ
jgi:Type I restriction and modification enzyme - subunit R C terminal